MVTVGNPGNASHPITGRGSVSFTYSIGKYEVTAAQYCDFLNHIAATDPYGLYDTRMDIAVDSRGCNIKRTGSPGSYSYSVPIDWANRPVNYVSWNDAARFVNWLNNGQPSGLPGSATTEDGAYCLTGVASQQDMLMITRKAGAKWVIPSDNEWYKAAYYDPEKLGGSGYWRYPTRSDSDPYNDGADGYSDPGNHVNFFNGTTYTIGSPYYRTDVGEFENSASAYGTFDQGGNVWEWDDLSRMDPWATACRCTRGLSWYMNTWDTNYLRWLQSYSIEFGRPEGLMFFGPQDDQTYDVGFRVGMVPEPGSIALLALAALCSAAVLIMQRASVRTGMM